MPLRNDAAKAHLITCFADALQKSVVAKMGGQWFCAASTTIEPPTEDPGFVVMQIRLRGTLHGELRIEIPGGCASLLSKLDESADLREGWHQVMEGLVQLLPKRALDAGMFAFSVASCALVEPTTGGTAIGKIELGQTDQKHRVLHVRADGELIESLMTAEWSVSRTIAKSQLPQAVVPELERVIDVPLSVTLRFGQRNMRLREVLELNTGVLVELDRQVEEPVDLILDERVIARGEVVIVDGNYGLRITEIVERPSTVGLS
jgi:flagellar motor switch protein FliN